MLEARASKGCSLATAPKPPCIRANRPWCAEPVLAAESASSFDVLAREHAAMSPIVALALMAQAVFLKKYGLEMTSPFGMHLKGDRSSRTSSWWVDHAQSEAPVQNTKLRSASAAFPKWADFHCTATFMPFPNKLVDDPGFNLATLVFMQH